MLQTTIRALDFVCHRSGKICVGAWGLRCLRFHDMERTWKVSESRSSWSCHGPRLRFIISRTTQMTISRIEKKVSVQTLASLRDWIARTPPTVGLRPPGNGISFGYCYYYYYLFKPSVKKYPRVEEKIKETVIVITVIIIITIFSTSTNIITWTGGQLMIMMMIIIIIFPTLVFTRV